MSDPAIEAYVAHHNCFLSQYIEHSEIPAPRLKEAILYSLFPGGKRLRPTLVYLCGELLSININTLDAIAAAVELIHCYSLVHDDLPSMDNDDYRRGRPSCHRAFDEATAILAGDSMQGLAVEVLLTHLPLTLSATKTIQVTSELAKASGPSGMISGQCLDITELTKSYVTRTQLEYIHQLKTGALFSTCIKMTLIAGDADETTADSLNQFAQILGVAFQMQDDYQDHYSAPNSLGKNRLSDVANEKFTFANLFNQQELHNLINRCYNKAHKRLEELGNRASGLQVLTQTLHQRTP